MTTTRQPGDDKGPTARRHWNGCSDQCVTATTGRFPLPRAWPAISRRNRHSARCALFPLQSPRSHGIDRKTPVWPRALVHMHTNYRTTPSLSDPFERHECQKDPRPSPRDQEGGRLLKLEAPAWYLCRVTGLDRCSNFHANGIPKRAPLSVQASPERRHSQVAQPKAPIANGSRKGGRQFFHGRGNCKRRALRNEAINN